MTLVHTVFRSVAADLWLATGVGLVALAATLVLGRRGLAFRQMLWALVLLRLLLPPSFTHPLALNRLWPGDWPLVAGSAAGDIGSAASEPNAMGDESGAEGRRHSHDVLALGLLGFWALTVTTLVLRDLRRMTACRRLVQAAGPIEDRALLTYARRLATDLGIRRAVGLRMTHAIVSPFAFGAFHPRIIIPARVIAMRDQGEAARAVVAHELAHIARGDTTWVWIQWLIQRLYFFHPVVWLAAHHLRVGREALCDERVVESGAMSSRAYARALLNVLALGLARPPAPAPTMSRGALVMRIRSIPDIPTKRTRARSAGRAAAIAVGLLVLPIGGQAPVLGESPSASAGETVSSPAPPVPLAHPLPGARVSLPFGPAPRHPFTKRSFTHKGTDLTAPLGTPIQAAGDGRIEVATTDYAPLKNAGTVVVVDHGGGYKTFYAHLGELLVHEGDRVRRGETIAHVGNTGLSTGPHLHFEVWREGERIAPEAMIPGLAQDED